MRLSPPPKLPVQAPAAPIPLLKLGLFALGHVVLALAMQRFPQLGTAHALLCVAIGVAIAARSPVVHTAYVVAYIVGSEVLWRMTSAGVFWEFGKYAVCLVIGVALLRMRLRRNRVFAVGYLFLLLPAAFLTLMTSDLGMARQQISFNLSGPLSLALCVLYFSNLRPTAGQVQTMFFAAIGPILGIVAIAYYSTVTTADLSFSGEANFGTSGGFGPNQVSAMLGLGLLFSLLVLLQKKIPWRLRAPLLILAVVFATQAALTFSRGGLFIAFVSAFAAAVYLVRDGRTRLTLMILGSLFFVVGKYVVIPRLEVFTSGKLSERYSSLDPTGRSILASHDLQIFFDNPILGVGPGAAAELRGELGKFGAAHTEFTRLLSEHGMLGVIAIIFLIALAVRTFRDARTLQARAYVVAMMTWATLFCSVNAMRLAAPSFMMGLACAIAFASIPPRDGARR